MGNKTSENDDFSKNANFDINQHRQQMAAYNSNYIQPNLQVNYPAKNRPNTSTSQFKQIKRTCSIYKPSINIHQQNQFFQLQFDYDAEQTSILEVFVDIQNVHEDPNTNITLRIDSKLFFQENLSMGKKMKFKKQYQLQGISKIQSTSIIIRIKSTFTSEITQYSLRYVKTNGDHWKILLEKFQLNNIVTQLQNIYKTDQNNDCIICMSQKAQILIQPCNHLCICGDCIQSLKNSTNKCPICRNNIVSYKKILQKTEN